MGNSWGKAKRTGTLRIAKPDADAPSSVPIPRINIASKFKFKVRADGSRTLKFGNPKRHGLEAHVDKNGVLGFDIRSSGNRPESGTDMFASMMQRLQTEGVEVTKVRGFWFPDSTNYKEFRQGIANGLSPSEAAAQTWTGSIVEKYGFDKVILPEDGIPEFGRIILHFEK